MCSISGIISKNPKKLNQIWNMIKIQSHRAPDEEGIFTDNQISLGMGRLKIIDLKTKNLTPFYDDRFVLLFNGEIYNYLELKKELKELGYKFRSNSDTEVLFKAWKQWKENIFQKINGMFAFCIYDKLKKVIFLARDIAGEKPLYYQKIGKELIFSSEAKSLTVISKPDLRKDKFYSTFQYCLEETLWKNVKQVKPSHYIKYYINTDKLEHIEYWKFKKRKIVTREAHEELDFLLKDSIKIRNRSDVKVGLYYSKGLDSTLLRIYNNYKKLLFFDDKKNYLNDFSKKIKKIAYHLDFPVGSLSSYPLLKLAEIAKKNKIKVVISGEGADEIFGGYVRYIPNSLQYYMNKTFPSYKPMFNKISNSYVENYSKLITRDGNYNYTHDKIKNYFEMFDDPINAMGYIDFKLIMPGLLQMGDRMSSSLGIENRCPFLDKRIIEFGFSLPPELKINGFTQKKLLSDLFVYKNKNKFNIVDEKKGLYFNINHWYNLDDQNRHKYFHSLNTAWKKAYRL